MPPSSRYELLRCVAAGGMGSIYYGIQHGEAGFARPVAIKRAHPELLGTTALRGELLAEARHGAAVRHPNVVGIDDVEEVGDELLLVMEYVDGCTLSTLLRSAASWERRLPRPVALRVLLDVCLGLEAIHLAKDIEGCPLGLVHCDVSPHNILVSTDGIARMIDFGLAQSARDRRPIGPYLRRGTFGYMAPEYIEHARNTPRSDLFAVGVIAWEALAGRRLFAGRSAPESLELTRAAAAPRLRAIDPTISIELERAVHKAIAQVPEERHASVRELGDALKRAARGNLAPRAEIAEHVAELSPSVRETAEANDTGTMQVATSELEIVPATKPQGKICVPSIWRRPSPPQRLAA